jgi:biopolymer transport protein ExbD
MRKSPLILRRRALLVEAPASAATDIAFILIIFFLVCASVQPDTGRQQIIPRSEEQEDKSKQSQNIEVSISPGAIVVNGNVVDAEEVRAKLKTLLAGREREADRVVVVKSARATSYERWIAVTEQIEEAGGTITLKLEKQQEVIIN